MLTLNKISEYCHEQKNKRKNDLSLEVVFKAYQLYFLTVVSNYHKTAVLLQVQLFVNVIDSFICSFFNKFLFKFNFKVF